MERTKDGAAATTAPAAEPAEVVSTLPPAEWLRAEDRVVVLAPGKWGLFSAKTGVQVLRFSRARVVAVIDPDREGEEAAGLVGLAAKGPVPIHTSLRAVLASPAALAAPPTRVLVGVAPPGGKLPERMRHDVELALEAGIPVLSGMHTFLADDPRLAARAAAHGTPIVDLRRPPPDPVVATGIGRRIPIPVILSVGTDCRAGKMTAIVALRQAARDAGMKAAFVASGQTGLLLEPDAGAPIDRVVSDFVAGETERQILAAARLDPAGERTAASPDLILVEGQGALSHPAYGSVSAGLLHGAWPDALVMCHVEGRTAKMFTADGAPFPVLPPAAEGRLVEAFLRPVWPARVAAVALAAPGLGDAEYARRRAALEAETGVPVFDVVREGAAGLLDAVLRELARRRTPREAPIPVRA